MPEHTIVCLHDKAQIEAIVRRNPLVHLYELGDLDDFFWPHTTWYGLRVGEQIEQLALIYSASDLPVILATPDPPRDSMRDLLKGLLALLPRRIYSHLDPQAAAMLETAYRLTPHGRYWKMGLSDPTAIDHIDTAEVVQLTLADQAALEKLYAEAYPGNWFSARMLQTGCYYGLRTEERIVAVAGVHVYSAAYGAAALGNVTTHPAYRGRGLSTMVCARLCQALRARGITHIGLNVRADNATAIAVYRRLGFEQVGEYGEYMLDSRC